MTPNKETTTYNDAPKDFKAKLTSEVLSLTESECAQLIEFIKSTFSNTHIDS